jgi:outer membrane immunogenic protein
MEAGMRRVFLTTISLLALTAAATAADIPRRAPAPAKAPVLVPLFTWSGFYIGLNGGYGWGTSTWTDAVTGSNSFDTSGGMVGLTLGANWQTGPWVLGLEGDVDWTNIRGSFANAACPAGCETKNTWLATVRGRAGYAFDRVLPYVTGGLAVGDVHATATGFGSQSETRTGWTVGAGIEGAFAQNWSAKVEYLYVDLGDVSCSAVACGIATSANFRANIVRGGINFRF